MGKKNKKPQKVSDTIVSGILEDLQKTAGELTSPDVSALTATGTGTATATAAHDKAVGYISAGESSRAEAEKGEPPQGLQLSSSNVSKYIKFKGAVDQTHVLEPKSEVVSNEAFKQLLANAEDEERALGRLKNEDVEKTTVGTVSPPPMTSNSTEATSTVVSPHDGHPVSQQTSTDVSATDKTIPMANVEAISKPQVKVTHGVARPVAKPMVNSAQGISEVQLLQAESFRIAQSRILELENEVEGLRKENENLASAGEIALARAEEYYAKLQAFEQQKQIDIEQIRLEMTVYRENLVEKEQELARAKKKIDELDGRLAKDFKKIRVRERELENRLELSKMEKVALLRAKDDALLDLKAKVDQLGSELESYKHKCVDLNKQVDGQTEQLSRTVRALRLALTHLEANQPTVTAVTPFKKAE